MTHGWLHHVKVTFEVTQTCYITNAMFAALRWPPLLSSQLLSCLPHLCQTPELFVMDDLVIKWERCWVSDRSLRSTWPSVIPFPFRTRASTRASTRTSALAQTLSQNLMHIRTSPQPVHVSWSLLHTHTRLHTGNTHSTKVYSYCKHNAHTYCVLSYPLLILSLPCSSS